MSSKPLSSSKHGAPEEQTSATHRSETEKSPPTSQSPSELPTPPNTSPNYGPQAGDGEVEDEEALDDLQDNDTSDVRASSSGIEPLRNFGLRLRGPEDNSWLVAASRPVFSLRVGPSSSRTASSTQQALLASSDSEEVAQEDSLPAPSPTQFIPFVPPPARPSSGRSGNQPQVPRPALPLPASGHTYSIWPSQDVVRGDGEARRAFLGAGGRHFFSGGQIFASLQEQGVIIPSTESRRKGLEDRTQPQEDAESWDGYDILGGNTSTHRKRPGEAKEEPSAKKSRNDEILQEQSNNNHDDDEIVEQSNETDADNSTAELVVEAQVDGVGEEPPIVNYEAGPQKGGSRANDGDALEQPNDVRESASREEQSDDDHNINAREESSAETRNDNVLVSKGTRSPDNVLLKEEPQFPANVRAIKNEPENTASVGGNEREVEIKAEVKAEVKEEMKEETKEESLASFAS